MDRFRSWRDESDEKLKGKLKLTDIMTAKMNELKGIKQNALSGNITLSKGAMSYIEELVDCELYNYNAHVSTKEMEKGSDTGVEDGAIDVYNRVFFTEHKKLVDGDEFTSLKFNSLVGHPDVVCTVSKMVKDAKSSWNKKTFPKRSEYNGTYEWQVKSYLYMLIGMTNDDSWRHGEVFHALVDTPESMVPEWESDSLHNMSDVPDNMRITVTPIELTDADIAHMSVRISVGLKYAEAYKKEILNKNK